LTAPQWFLWRDIIGAGCDSPFSRIAIGTIPSLSTLSLVSVYWIRLRTSMHQRLRERVRGGRDDDARLSHEREYIYSHTEHPLPAPGNLHFRPNDDSKPGIGDGVRI
jgi:hypothetical protein